MRGAGPSQEFIRLSSESCSGALAHSGHQATKEYEVGFLFPDAFEGFESVRTQSVDPGGQLLAAFDHPPNRKALVAFMICFSAEWPGDVGEVGVVEGRP